MWRVVCKGSGPKNASQRIIDRGPLLPSESRAKEIAAWLRSTGLYDSVIVEHCNKTALPSAPTSY